MTNPRVLVLGDSWIKGLSKGKGTASRLLPEALGAAETLDLSKVSRIVPDYVRDHLDAIDAFAPDVAVLAIGGADSLVFPARWIQRIIDRYAPPDWQGIEGMQPRALYSRDRRKRVKQQAAVFLKMALKQFMVNFLGWHRRISLAEYEQAATAVLDLLAAHETTVVLVGVSDVDHWMSPKSRKCIRAANRVNQRLAQRYARVLFVDASPMVTKWTDYLPDRVHLTLPGHATVTGGVVAAMAAAGGVWAAAVAPKVTELSIVDDTAAADLEVAV